MSGSNYLLSNHKANSGISDVHIKVSQPGLRSSQLVPSPDLLPLLEKVAINKNVIISVFDYAFLPQHFLYFFPLPQGQGSLGYTFLPSLFTVPEILQA